MSGFIKELYSVTNPANIIIEALQKQPYETDWRNKYQGKSLAVIKPTSTKDIKNIILLSAKNNIKITVQGGNTSTCGASVPINDNSYHHIILLREHNKKQNLPMNRFRKFGKIENY